MSNTPLPDIVCLWSDKTKLKYSLLTGKTSIFCPHVRTNSLFCDENKKFKKSFSFSKSTDFHQKNKNDDNYDKDYDNNNNCNDGNNKKKTECKNKNDNDNKNENENEKGFYWEGDLINERSSLSSPFSPFSSFSSTYSPSSTTHAHSLENIELNPLPISLKIYLIIAQKAIKRILREENEFTCFTSKFTKTTRNVVKNKNKKEVLMFPRNVKNSDFNSHNKNYSQNENDLNQKKKDIVRENYNCDKNMNDRNNLNRQSSYPRIFVDHL